MADLGNQVLLVQYRWYNMSHWNSITRLGSELENSFCDDMKGKLAPATSYSTADLISLFRNDTDFTFYQLVGWIFKTADWINDSIKNNEAIDVLNQFIADNPPISGNTPTLVSCTSELCQMAFTSEYLNSGISAAQQEAYKQALCDLIIGA